MHAADCCCATSPPYTWYQAPVTTEHLIFKFAANRQRLTEPQANRIRCPAALLWCERFPKPIARCRACLENSHWPSAAALLAPLGGREGSGWHIGHELKRTLRKMPAKRKPEPLVVRQPKRGRVAGPQKPAPVKERFTTVRVKLQTVLTACGKALGWEQYVRDGNKLVLEAWVLANSYVNSRVRDNQPVPPLNQSFFYQVCSWVTDTGCSATKSVDGLPEIAEQHRAARAATYRPVASAFSSGLCQLASLQMATNTQVSVATVVLTWHHFRS